MPATSWAVNHLLHYDTLSFPSCPTQDRHGEQEVLITYLVTWMSNCSSRICKWCRQVSYMPSQSPLQHTHSNFLTNASFGLSKTGGNFTAATNKQARAYLMTQPNCNTSFQKEKHDPSALIFSNSFKNSLLKVLCSH